MKKSAILAPSTLNFAAIVRQEPEAFQDFFSHIARLGAVSNNRRIHREAVMYRPKVGYQCLEESFLDSGHEHHYWLDKKAGEVLFYDSEIVCLVESGADLKKIPSWQREFVKNARRAMRVLGELPNEDEDLDKKTSEPQRYVVIPTYGYHAIHQDMMDFIRIVARPSLSEALLGALRSDRPSRRFEDALLDYPNEKNLWRAFSRRRLRERIERWAREEGIEIDYPEKHWPSDSQRLRRVNIE